MEEKRNGRLLEKNTFFSTHNILFSFKQVAVKIRSHVDKYVTNNERGDVYIDFEAKI